jgi:succinyl-diaminopimelate desuccinylase
MTDEQLLETTKDLIAIPSVTSDHGETRKALDFMVRFIKKRTKDKNVSIEKFVKDGVSSLLAYKGKERPANFRILFNVHVDVVAAQLNQFKAIVKNGKLYGRGAHDEKAATIILANAFAEFVDRVPYPLGLQIVTDEEVGGYNGTKYQIEQGVRADFVICGECGRTTNVHEIANEAKGIVFTEVVFQGRAGHGAYLWRHDNAAAKAAAFIQKLHQRYPIPSGPYDGTTVSVTGMSADGGAYTRIPDYAKVRLDFRFTSDDPNFRSRAHFAALIEEIDATAELQNCNLNAPLYSDPRNPLLLSLKASAEKIEKAPFSFVRRHATSDGRHFSDLGDQACEFGVAGEHQHADLEYVTIKAFKNYRATIDDYLTKTIETEKGNEHTRAYDENGLREKVDRKIAERVLTKEKV